MEAADGDGAEEIRGTRSWLGKTKFGRVFERRRSERVDSLIDDPEADQALARRWGLQAAMYVPLITRDEAIGIIVAGDKQVGDHRFTDDDLRVAEAFAARAAVAVQIRRRSRATP